MSTLLERAGSEVLVFDGAIGTLLVAAGADPALHLDHLNITAPDMVESVHRQYIQAGADIITTNTFQASRPRLVQHGLNDQLEAINREGVRIARKVKAPYVAASVGPIGLLQRPLGEATFDEIYAVFREQIEALAQEGPDLILIETQGDIADLRAAVLAAKECCDIPVVASCAFGSDGRTNLSGTPPEVAALVLSRLGADIAGCNCGLGPAELYELARRMPAYSSSPVLCRPNAGIPKLERGTTVWPGSPDVSGDFAARMVEAGIAIVGSCCGTTPSYTAAIAARVDHDLVHSVERVRGLLLASRSALVAVGPGSPTIIIGDRLNPSGRKHLAEALRAGDFGPYRQIAIEQVQAGADVLDVNVGVPGLDEVAALLSATHTAADAVTAPLVLDSTNPEALEQALRHNPGRALVNSVNGAEDSLAQILPLVAKYGACAIIMPLDERGIPADAADRLAIAARVLERAAPLGLAPDDFLIDGIVMAAAAGPETATATFETVGRARAELGIGTVLGVSNISHGLPNRAVLNRAFIAMAQQAGVDALLVDPLEPQNKVVLAAGDLLSGRDPRGTDYVEKAAGLTVARPSSGAQSSPAERLARVVLDGDVDGAQQAAEEALAAGIEPLQAISGILTPAIQKVGEAFGKGEAFLPQVMLAAEAMKRAVARLKSEIHGEAGRPRGVIILATVSGDIHNIGKDIVATLLESHGYRVIDLGVDVPAERVIAAVEAEGADLVGLSALMTTTLPNMADAARIVAEKTGVKVMVGGAVLTPEWADSIGAAYAPDAIEAVEVVDRLLG